MSSLVVKQHPEKMLCTMCLESELCRVFVDTGEGEIAVCTDCLVEIIEREASEAAIYWYMKTGYIG